VSLDDEGREFSRRVRPRQFPSQIPALSGSFRGRDLKVPDIARIARFPDVLTREFPLLDQA